MELYLRITYLEITFSFYRSLWESFIVVYEKMYPKHRKILLPIIVMALIMICDCRLKSDGDGHSICHV
jgi:hypothetical protein